MEYALNRVAAVSIDRSTELCMEGSICQTATVGAGWLSPKDFWFPNVVMIRVRRRADGTVIEKSGSGRDAGPFEGL